LKKPGGQLPKDPVQLVGGIWGVTYLLSLPRLLMSLSEDHRPRERLIREIRYSTKVSHNKVPGRKSVYKVFYLLSKKEEEKWEARRPP
jgi:hypothetical protein